MSARISAQPPRDDSIRSLVSGMDAWHRQRCPLVMLQVFCDDSGNSRSDDVFVLGGFVSCVDKWEQFSDEWRSVLAQEPALEYFKSSEARRREKQFRANWNRQLIDQRILELTDVICKYAEHRIHSFVYRSQFDLLIKSVGRHINPKFGQQFTNPYWHCFYGICVSAAHLSKLRGEDVPCELIFDEQGALGLDTVASWEIMKGEHDEAMQPHFGSPPVFKSDKRVLPLQAADLYAWHLHSQIASALENHVIHDHIKSRLAKIHLIENHWSLEKLIKIRDILIRQLEKHPEMLSSPVSLPERF